MTPEELPFWKVRHQTATTSAKLTDAERFGLLRSYVHDTTQASMRHDPVLWGLIDAQRIQNKGAFDQVWCPYLASHEVTMKSDHHIKLNGDPEQLDSYNTHDCLYPGLRLTLDWEDCPLRQLSHLVNSSLMYGLEHFECRIGHYTHDEGADMFVRSGLDAGAIIGRPPLTMVYAGVAPACLCSVNSVYSKLYLKPPYDYGDLLFWAVFDGRRLAFEELVFSGPLEHPEEFDAWIIETWQRMGTPSLRMPKALVFKTLVPSLEACQAILDHHEAHHLETMHFTSCGLDAHLLGHVDDVKKEVARRHLETEVAVACLRDVNETYRCGPT